MKLQTFFDKAYKILDTMFLGFFVSIFPFGTFTLVFFNKGSFAFGGVIFMLSFYIVGSLVNYLAKLAYASGAFK